MDVQILKSLWGNVPKTCQIWCFSVKIICLFRQNPAWLWGIVNFSGNFIFQLIFSYLLLFKIQREPTNGKTKGRYRSIVQACSRIYKEEGLAALWKGHVPAQGLSAVYGIVQFATFEFLTEQLTRYPRKFSGFEMSFYLRFL